MSIAFLDEQISKRDRASAPVRRGHGQTAARRPRLAAASTPRSRPVRASLVALPTSPGAGPHVRLVDGRHAAAVALPDACSARRSSGKLRLTPRGRVVLGAFLVILALVVFSLGRFTAGAEASGPPQHVTVQSGDTLWGIAEHVAPQGDPRAEVDRIIAANHLPANGSLTPGSMLLVPRG